MLSMGLNMCLYASTSFYHSLLEAISSLNSVCTCVIPLLSQVLHNIRLDEQECDTIILEMTVQGSIIDLANCVHCFSANVVLTLENKSAAADTYVYAIVLRRHPCSSQTCSKLVFIFWSITIHITIVLLFAEHYVR